MQRRIYFCIGAVCFFLFCLPHFVQAADTVTGQALIENGDIVRAREDARKDAMRTFVEQAVGVHIDSATEVANGMVISDQILAHSDGYVQVERVVKEWQSGNVYFMQFEMEANQQKIQTAPQDLKSRLMAMDNNATRSGIQIAIVGRDKDGKLKELSQLNQYLQAKLENIGFRTTTNDEVMDYLAHHAQDDALSIGVETRRIFRASPDRNDGNALVRGTLSTIAVDRDPSGYYTAVVNASFELIGLDSNDVNTFSENFAVAASTAVAAEERANLLAVQKAADTLGQKALETVQEEYRGGVKHIKITIRFAGITDRMGQRQQILDGLSVCGCRAIRTAFTGDGEFRVFIETDRYNSNEELKEAILSQIMGLQEGNENEVELGSKKLDFTF